MVRIEQQLVCGFPGAVAGVMASYQEVLEDEIEQLCARYPTYGYRRITQLLANEGYTVGYRRVARLMKEKNLTASFFTDRW